MKFDCHECSFSKEVSDKYAGKKVKCPKCGTPNLLQQKIVSAATVEAVHETIQKDNNVYSLDAFLEGHKEKSSGKRVELESERILELKTDEGVWIKSGSMVSYKGDVELVRENILQFGVKNLLKRALTPEGGALTKASGKGSIYVADSGKKITLLKLKNDSIIVNGNDVLAFEKSVKWDVTMLKSAGEMMSGGLFQMKLSGTGYIAITTHYDPLVLEVGSSNKITTDPHATVAWSGGVEPQFKSQVQLKTFFGRGSGDTLQMTFKGKGFVVVQPFEEHPPVRASNGSGRAVKPQGVMAFVLFIALAVFGQMGGKDSTRTPASKARSTQKQSLQIQIDSLQAQIRAKGTQATQEEKMRLKSLKRQLRNY